MYPRIMWESLVFIQKIWSRFSWFKINVLPAASSKNLKLNKQKEEMSKLRIHKPMIRKRVKTRQENAIGTEPGQTVNGRERRTGFCWAILCVKNYPWWGRSQQNAQNQTFGWQMMLPWIQETNGASRRSNQKVQNPSYECPKTETALSAIPAESTWSILINNAKTILLVILMTNHNVEQSKLVLNFQNYSPQFQTPYTALVIPSTKGKVDPNRAAQNKKTKTSGHER